MTIKKSALAATIGAAVALTTFASQAEMWGGDHFYIERETQENRCEPCSVRD